MNPDSPSSTADRQSSVRRVYRVVVAAVRLIGRRSTWVAVFRAVDFLLSNEIYTYASAIAFNSLIAFFPAAIVALTLVSMWGGPELHDEMVKAIINYIPANQAFFQHQIAAVTHNFSGMTVVSLGILLFSAVGIFVPVELALNYVWKERDARHWLVSQLISFVLLGVLILIAIIPVYLALQFERLLDTVLFFLRGSAITAFLSAAFLKLVALPFSVLAFGIVYTVLPKKRLALEQVAPAALFTGLGFEIFRYVYMLVLPLLGLKEMYGAFYVSVTFITWALFAAMLMLMGAYLTASDLLPRVRWSRGRTLPNSGSGGVVVAPPGNGG